MALCRQSPHEGNNEEKSEMITSKSNLLDPDECGGWLKEKRQQSCNPLKTETWDSEQLQAMREKMKGKKIDIMTK